VLTVYNAALDKADKISGEVVKCFKLMKKLFYDHWKQKLMVCSGVGAMKYCSCLLRSCTAALINQWESSREKLAQNQPKLLAATCRVIEFMRKVSAL